MSFQSLRAEEERVLDKLTARANRYRAEDPRLSFSAAFAHAAEKMPNTYRAYESVRRQLIAMGLCPTIPSGLGLSGGR